MLMNVVIASGASDITGGIITVKVYGGANETVLFTGSNSTSTIVLDSSGYGTINIESSYYLVTGNNESAKIYPNGLTVKLTPANNIVYLRPQSTIFWYGVQGNITWIPHMVSGYHNAAGTPVPGGSDAEGWSLSIYSNSVSEYYTTVKLSSPLSILRDDGTKYTKCYIMASGTEWALQEGYYNGKWIAPHGYCYVGILENEEALRVNGDKVIRTFDLSTINGNTITPFIKTHEQWNTGSSSKTKTTTYAIWFE